jgi:alginate O-acetyltransferase complex protein AlgI
MVFSAPIFLFLFLPVVLALYFATPPRGRNLLLLVASLVFYAWGEPRFVLVMLASALVNYGFALGLGAIRHRRLVLALAVAVNLGLLAVYKYGDFVVTNVDGLLGRAAMPPIPLPRLALPLGISFFTFHALSYLIDVYREKVPAQKNPLRVALYIALFPQLIAGPIVRYAMIAPEIARRHTTRDDLVSGIERFVVGLGKKVLIANTLATPADAIFGLPPAGLSAGLAWFGVVCYTLQIYFDFSGYSDMAIGLARIFGFHFPENFCHPYVSRSLTEFWRRWHISLSTWFRDYLYVPLGGNRRGSARLYRNLLIVFTLCGLWHGASWTFLIWGLYHGAFLAAERVAGARSGPGGWRPLAHAYALLVVMVGWVLFRSPSLGHAWGMLGAMAGFGGGELQRWVWTYLDGERILALAAGLLGSMPALVALGRWQAGIRADPLGAVLALGRAGGLLLVLLASSVRLAAGTHNPFIYFRF